MNDRNPDSPITLFDIFSSIFHYKWRVVLVSCVCLALSFMAILLLPRKYESEAKLFVRLGRSSAGVDPAAMGSMISIQDSRETEMNSIIDMLHSRGLADEVVDAIGIDRILEKHAWSEIQLEKLSEWVQESLIGQAADEVVAVSASGGVSERKELAVGELMSNLKIGSPKKATTLSVVSRARTPELANEIVQQVIEKYKQMHILSTKSEGSVPFFQEEFARQDTKLKELEAEFRTLKDSSAMLTLNGKQDSLQEEQNSIKQLQLTTRADLSAARSRVASLQDSLKLLPEKIDSETTTGIEAGASDAMRERLFELEIREKELASQFLYEHPELVKVREQLTETRAIFQKQSLEREHKVVAASPVWMEKRSELMTAEAEVAGLQEKLNQLENLETSLLSRITELNRLELRSESLWRDIQIARDNHANYARKLEESRINEELDRGEMSNVSVVSPPTIRLKAVSPKRSTLVLVAGLFSLMAGVFVALASEYLKTNRIERKSRRDGARNRRITDRPVSETTVRESRSTEPVDQAATSSAVATRSLPR